MNCSGVTNSIVGATPPGELFQTAWFVDATNGNDANPGTAALPIKTLAELQMRFEGKRLTANTTVTLIGDFAESLILNCVIADGVTLTVSGATTQQHAGTIGTFTPLAAPATPASIQDAGMTAANEVNRRVRITSGLANGAITWGLKATAADTLRVGQFVETASIGSPKTPANGDSYVTETLNSSITGYAITIAQTATGTLGLVVIRDLRINVAAFTFMSITGGAPLQVIACSYEGAGTLNFVAPALLTHIGCQVRNVQNWRSGYYNIHGCVFFGNVALVDQCTWNVQVAANCWQGAKLSAARGALIEAFSDIAIFDAPAAGNDAAMTLNDSAAYDGNGAAARFWTVNPLQAYGIRVRSGCIYSYTTKPTATGVTNDTIVGGTVKAYAAIPYIEVANNAAIVLRA